jgi:hypothetical protein
MLFPTADIVVINTAPANLRSLTGTWGRASVMNAAARRISIRIPIARTMVRRLSPKEEERVNIQVIFRFPAYPFAGAVELEQLTQSAGAD